MSDDVLFQPLTDEQITELNFSNSPFGPSSRGCCKVLNGNACGSGSLVGERGGKSLVLTNAHVAGTRIGHTVICEFPFANNQRSRGRVIMAGYSDRVMMDWAILELDAKLNLPHVKLNNTVPRGQHYTGGYPRCRGPFFQKLTTQRITHNGTVWRWQPNSVGGQSGSGVHSLEDNLQYGLLTWTWGGDGAGQTTRGIWMQYVSRAALGYLREPDMIELAENRAEDLEEGFHSLTNITSLRIWSHLDEPEDPPTDPDDPDKPPKGCPELAARLMAEAKDLQDQAVRLTELARRFGDGGGNGGEDDGDGGDDDDGPTFGL